MSSARWRPKASPEAGRQPTSPDPLAQDSVERYHVDCLHHCPMATDPTLSRLELLQGTLDFIILQTLRWGPRHGYGLAQMIRANSHNLLQVETGSLYPALHRLTRKKWVKSAW